MGRYKDDKRYHRVAKFLMEQVLSDKIKIVRIIARLNIGGPAIHAILLSRGFNGGGYKDILVTGRSSESEGDMTEVAQNNGVKPILVSALGRNIAFLKDFMSLCALYSILKREKPDIVHTHTAKAGMLGRVAAILAGVPVKIHTFHGHVLSGYFGPFKTGLFKSIERILSYFTDKVVVVSEGVRREMVDKLKVVSADKCVVIKLGLDLKPFLENQGLVGSFRKEIGLDRDTLSVGMVGRLVPIKNHEMFLNVARRIKNIAPDIKVKFIVIGDGETRKRMEGYAKKMNLEGDLIFTGWVKNLPAVYADLDVVALTSLNEGTPVSLIEAMTSGRPVIATDVGGVKDIVMDNENGFLIRSEDVDGFTNKLLELLKNKDKRRIFGARGREFAREQYSEERLMKDIKNLYGECLNNRRQK